MLIMPEFSLTQTSKEAEKIRSGIADDFRIDYNGQILNITASFGVAGFSDQSDTINDVLKAADHALRRAKTGGRNRIVVV